MNNNLLTLKNMKKNIILITLLSLLLISCSEKQNVKSNDTNVLNKINQIKTKEELKKEELQKENELLKKKELQKSKLQKNDEWLEKKTREEA